MPMELCLFLNVEYGGGVEGEGVDGRCELWDERREGNLWSVCKINEKN